MELDAGSVLLQEGAEARVTVTPAYAHDLPFDTPTLQAGPTPYPDLWRIDLAPGAGAARVIGGTMPNGPQCDATVSRDGSLVAFTSSHEIISNRSGDWQIHTVRADGTELARRTSTVGDESHPV